VTVGAMLAGGLAQAYGPHDGLDCLGCHDPHYAKEKKLFTVTNPSHPNPRTGKNIDGISALCLGCHNLSEDGGAGVKPIYLHTTHPVNVKPNERIANMPEQLKRDDLIQCVSCHDPHPSNPNWRYLRVKTSQGNQVGKFCSVCHGSKVDENFYGQDLAQSAHKIFSSMNEAAGAGEYTLDDPELTIANETPDYIRPLGAYENTIMPMYKVVPTLAWNWDAAEQRGVPAELQALRDRIASEGAAEVTTFFGDNPEEQYFNPFED
jgi:predicted CXXCH cytochrome family protein